MSIHMCSKLGHVIIITLKVASKREEMFGLLLYACMRLLAWKSRKVLLVKETI